MLRLEREKVLRNEISQYFGWVGPGIHGCISFLDLAILIYEITDPLRITSAGLIARAIRQAQAPGGVAQKQERKVEFFGKIGVFFNHVKTDTKNFNIL